MWSDWNMTWPLPPAPFAYGDPVYLKQRAEFEATLERKQTAAEKKAASMWLVLKKMEQTNSAGLDVLLDRLYREA